MWKIRFKNQVTACSDCPPEAMLRIKEVENNWFTSSAIKYHSVMKTCRVEETRARQLPHPEAPFFKKNGRVSFLEKKESALFSLENGDWQNLVF